MTSRASKSELNEKLSRGFTLVELLLVLAIIGVVTAVVLPSAVRSMRGNRLRMAALRIATVGRYARSIAVLKQQEIVLGFIPGSLAEKRPAQVVVFGCVTSILDGVELALNEIGDTPPKSEAPWLIAYEPNGRCMPYRLTIRDERGEEIVMEVDEIASARTASAWRKRLWGTDER